MEVNWLAFAAAVVAQIVIGFVWFHPSVMGSVYAKARGITVDELKPKNPGLTYGLTILMTIFFTMFLMANVTGPGQDTAPDGHSYHTFGHGLVHAMIFLFMVLIPVFGTPALFENKGRNWFLIHIGYWGLRAVAAFGILSMWR